MRRLAGIITTLWLGCAPGSSSLSATAESEPLVQAGIQYHNGGVQRTATVNFIFYGNWPQADQMQRLQTFVWLVDGSDYWSVLGTYTDGAGQPIQRQLRLGPSAFNLGYSHGHTPSTDDYNDIVRSSLNAGTVNFGGDNVYFVVPSPDVPMPLANAFAYHTWMPYAGTTISVGVLGPPYEFALSHELGEMMTDPTGGGWWVDAAGRSRGEVGDLCNYEIDTMTDSQGNSCNLWLGTYCYGVTNLWVNDGRGYCGRKAGLHVVNVGAGSGGIVIANVPDHDTFSMTHSQSWRFVYDSAVTPSVTYTAVPNPGWTFGSWSGCDSQPSARQCTVATSDRAVSASFHCTPQIDETCFSDCVDTCDGTRARCIPQCRQQCSSCS